MSEIYKDRERHHVYAGLTVDVAEDSLDKVTALLAGVESNVGKAVGSALKRAAAAGKTVAKKAVADEYTLSQSEFLSQTKNINHINRESSGEVSVAFGFAGYVIPLLKFDTCVGSDGRVQTHVKRSSAGKCWTMRGLPAWAATVESMSASASNGTRTESSTDRPHRR